MVPYEPKPLANLTVNGGGRGVFPLELPSRSLLYRLCVVQTSGASDSFAVSLFNAEPAANDLTQPGPLPPLLFRATPRWTSTAGSVVFYSDQHGQGFGFPLFSHDGSRLGNLRRFWLVIEPQGSGPKEFSAAVGVMSLD